MVSAWMVRSNGGLWYDDFKDNNCVYIGKWDLGDVDFQKAPKEYIKSELIKIGKSSRGAGKIASEIKWFLDRVKTEDFVVTAAASSKKYAFGRIKGPVVNEKREIRGKGRIKLTEDYVYSRAVEWVGEVLGYNLSGYAKASLYPKQAVFEIRQGLLDELLRLIRERKSQRLSGFGPEGKKHKELKEYIKENPGLLGISNVIRSEIEYGFLSGDRVDVYFECKGGKYAVVEIETTYPEPGVYQALKYRVLLCAELLKDINTPEVQAYLVAWEFEGNLKKLARKYGVITKEVKL